LSPLGAGWNQILAVPGCGAGFTRSSNRSAGNQALEFSPPHQVRKRVREIPNQPQDELGRTLRIIRLRLVGKYRVQTRPDRTERSGNPAPVPAPRPFQKANLRPKLVCTKSFTDELKLCWPPPTQL